MASHFINILECSKRLGLTKQAILSRIKKGYIDANKDDNGVWKITDNEKISEKHTRRPSKKNNLLVKSSSSEEEVVQGFESNGVIKNQVKELLTKVKIQDEGLSKLLSKKRKTDLRLLIAAGVAILLLAVNLIIALGSSLSEKQVTRRGELLPQEPKWLSQSSFESRTLSRKGNRGFKERRIRAGFDYLLSRQKEGLWSEHAGLSAICATVMLKNPMRDEEYRQAGLKTLAKLQVMQKPDGSIVGRRGPFSIARFNTALAILAFEASPEKGFVLSAIKASGYLETLNFNREKDLDESNGVSSTHLGGKENYMKMALGVLKESGVDENDIHFRKALDFIHRCQQNSNNNSFELGLDREFYANTDVFYKDTYASDGNHSQLEESMSFRGLQSLMFHEVDRQDSSMVDVKNWMTKNFTVKSHPGMGQVSVYYYFYTLSKALKGLSLDKLEMEDGRVVDWRDALEKELFDRQRDDGSWVNYKKEYLEGDPALATAYALGALNQIYEMKI